jgi:hypothetical protein
MFYLLPLDIETGGIGLDKSLLTLFAKMVRWDGKQIRQVQVNFDYELADYELDLKIKPNDGIYRVTGTAMEINKIDLAKHDKVAITEKEAGTKTYKYLEKCYKVANAVRSEPVKLIPCGHNVAFDIRHIKECLISEGSFNQFVSYRCLDTCSMAQGLRLVGKLPENLECSLKSLGEYFGIKPESGELHDAKYDTLLSIGVLEKLLQLTGV